MSAGAERGDGGPGEGLEELLEFIRDHRGFDFTGYKRASLRRRIAKRMETVGIETYSDYLAQLEANQDEFAALFDTILINVTRFFRDPATWEFVRAELVPRILERKGPSEPIRVWSAGAASGEEAYTAAILLADAVGDGEFGARVKVYATDVDEGALAEARQASYSAKALEDVPEELRKRYFVEANGRRLVRGDLRRAVVFGRHDLVRDPPISHVDLLIARNTLMYFDAQVQAKILSDFHYSLGESGYLFLGTSEILLSRSTLFEPVHLKCRVFAKRAGAGGDRPRFLPTPSSVPQVERPDAGAEMEELGFEAVPIAQLVVDVEGRLALANEHARRLFGLALADVGRPFHELEVSYRPLELRSQLELVTASGEPVEIRDVNWRVDDEPHVFEVHVTPLPTADGDSLGAAVTFTDVTRYRRLQDVLGASMDRLETAYEELQSTSEELETTNEELQSTNEELETTNEELQSTNEELETMNEELQSSNDELEAMNDELRLSTDELNDANAFLESVLGSLHSAVVVVDAELVVVAWNEHAVELFGVRGDEARGRHLLNLDVGMPLETAATLVRGCLADGATHEAEVEAVDRRGRAIACAVRASPLLRDGGETRGAILQVEERDPAGG